MESWKIVWRDGVSPSLSTAGLEALKKALETDDARLLQGATTCPPPLAFVQDWPTEGADAIGFAYWMGDRGGEASVGDVEEFFARTAFEADRRCGEPSAVRWFLNFHDDEPRDRMRASLLEEVELTLSERSKLQKVAD